MPMPWEIAGFLTKEEYEADKKQRRDGFIEDCRFAKIVKTPEGDAFLIGGEIIRLVSTNPKFHMDCVVSALRSSQPRSEALSGQIGSLAKS